MNTHRKRFLAAILAGTTSLAMTAPVLAQEVDEVIVTGSHIKKKSQFDSASPISTIDQAEIDTTGFTTSSELIRWMPYNTGSENQANALTQGNTPGTSNINLRGLGLGSTLVLINGRRQTVSAATANGGDTFVDINSMMPMIMVQRLETLKDGASAVYGADAVAGVVNFITRDNFEGMEVRFDRAQTSRSDDQSDTTVSAIWGASNDQSSVVVAASYLHRDGMFTTDRDFPYKTVSAFGNPGSFLDVSDGVTYTADPGCLLSASSILGPVHPLVPALGTFCRYDFGPNYSLVPDESRLSVYATAKHSVSENLNFYAEFGMNRNQVKGGYSSSFPLLAFPSIPSSHPANPFGEDVRFFGRVIGDGLGAPGDSRVINWAEAETIRTVVGAEGDVPWAETWSYDLSHTYSQNSITSTAYDQVGKRVSEALNGVAGSNCAVGASPGDPGCLWFNPFATSLTAAPGDVGFYNTDEVLAYVSSPNMGYSEVDMWAVDFTVAGDVLELPAGTLQAAFGFQHQKESRRNIESADGQNEDLVFLIGGQNQSGDRAADGYFAEFAVPLLDDESLGTVDLDVALRYTNYDGAWNSTDPKVGLVWQPMDQLSVRASWSTSFRAPTLFQIANTSTSLNSTQDDLAGTPAAFIGWTTTPNPDLEPEEAETLSFGFSWTPETDLVTGLTIGVDYYKVTYENLLASGNGQEILDELADAWTAAACPAAPVVALADAACIAIATDPRVVRDYDTATNTGTLASFRVFTDRFNASFAETDGFDLNVTYAPDYQLLGGDMSFRSESTYVNKFEFQSNDASPIYDGAGNRNAGNSLARSIPQWRSNNTFSWAKDRHSAIFIVRYISSYEDGHTIDGINPVDIDSWTTLDVQYTYDMSDYIGLGGTLLTFGSNNVLDEDPPLVSSGAITNDFGYDVKVHDPRGRMLYVRVAQQF